MRFLYPLYLFALVAFVLVGCDNGSLTATENLDTHKPEVALNFSEEPSADDIRKDDGKAFGTVQPMSDKIEDQYIIVFKEGTVRGRFSVRPRPYE